MGKILCLVHTNTSTLKWALYSDFLEVWLPIVPRKGKANQLLLKELGNLLGVSISTLSIIQGLKSRRKIIQIQGIDQPEIELRLKTAIT